MPSHNKIPTLKELENAKLAIRLLSQHANNDSLNVNQKALCSTLITHIKSGGSLPTQLRHADSEAQKINDKIDFFQNRFANELDKKKRNAARTSKRKWEIKRDASTAKDIHACAKQSLPSECKDAINALQALHEDASGKTSNAVRQKNRTRVNNAHEEAKVETLSFAATMDEDDEGDAKKFELLKEEERSKYSF